MAGGGTGRRNRPARHRRRALPAPKRRPLRGKRRRPRTRGDARGRGAGLGANTMSAVKVQQRRAFATIEEAIEDVRQGKVVVVVDAADRENEGDLTIAAQFATPEAVNFMTKEARGLICLCLT